MCPYNSMFSPLFFTFLPKFLERQLDARCAVWQSWNPVDSNCWILDCWPSVLSTRPRSLLRDKILDLTDELWDNWIITENIVYFESCCRSRTVNMKLASLVPHPLDHKILFCLISCSNLMHHFFITFIMFLYMFRATFCSSSGGFIVYIQHLVLCMSLFLGDRSVHRQLESSNCLCTEQSPKKRGIQRTRCWMYTMNPPDDEHKVARNM